MFTSLHCLPVFLSVYPVQFLSFTENPVPVNGSSASGNCSEYNTASSLCTDPASSVLFDGIIPTLSPPPTPERDDADNNNNNDNNENEWAAELVTIPSSPRSRYAIVTLAFYFSSSSSGGGDADLGGGSAVVGRLEMALFNCPAWGVSVGSVSVQEWTSGGGIRTLVIQSVRAASCDSLVRVCIPVRTDATLILVSFYSVPAPEFFVHLAEMAFFADDDDDNDNNNNNSSTSCFPDEVVASQEFIATMMEELFDEAGNNTTTNTTTDDNSTATTVIVATPTTPPTTLTQCPNVDDAVVGAKGEEEVACVSCSASNSLASVVSAVVTALLATVALTTTQVLVCKQRRQRARLACKAGLPTTPTIPATPATATTVAQEEEIQVSYIARIAH